MNRLPKEIELLGLFDNASQHRDTPLPVWSRFLQSGASTRLRCSSGARAPLNEDRPQRVDVHFFVHFQTVKRHIRKSAHPRFDAMIGEVEEESFAPASRDVTTYLPAEL